MVNPISSAQSSQASEAVKAAATQTSAQPPQKSSSTTFRHGHPEKHRAGDVDHDGDSH